jgi:beta-ribofuranosylaminobenzene 5'-phosphate synthase
MNSLEIINELERQRRLSRIERILAVTNGSVTQILELWLGEDIRIRTLSQEVRQANELGTTLGIEECGEVNFREVEIIDQRGHVLIKARSWIPVERLEPEFKEDLMKADVPIGKLLIKHKIEARRELLDVKLENGKIVRHYNIISKGKILMRIEETLCM